MNKKTMNKNQTSMLYCPMTKKTQEFVTERYERTKDIFEAVGWSTLKQCIEDIENMDEPENWTYAIKITNVNMIKGESNE